MKTALYERHCELGAKMAPFAGWDMPIQYQSVLAEHRAVRENVGLFDVSHMGRIAVRGADAEKLLDKLSTNKIAGKESLTATYTVWCHPDGGSVDDVMIYKIEQNEFFVIVNAANRQKDLEHLKWQAAGFQVEIQDYFCGHGILALQGPLALSTLSTLYLDIGEMKPMHFQIKGDLVISRTGYTGADGFEIYGPDQMIVELWDRLLKEGAVPVGLGARDTLRLEMGFALYGHELTDSIAPNESVAEWTIKWNKGDFIGLESLKKIEANESKRRAYGVRLLDKSIARQGSPVIQERGQIGEVTSGSFSPSLNGPIALILVNKPLNKGERVEILVRNKTCLAEVVVLPFINRK